MGIFSDPFTNYRRVGILFGIAVLSWAFFILAKIEEANPPQDKVVLIVFDGLRADAIGALGPTRAPNFHRLIRQGASTFNARTDPRSTNTLPNMVSMLTGRPVFDGEGAHKYMLREYNGWAVHDVKQEYVDSVFDVLYQNNLKSSFFASKDKLGLFVKSYTIPEKDVKKKNPSRFQRYFISKNDDSATLEKFLFELREFDSRFIFLHLAGADLTGHKMGWSAQNGSDYMKAVIKLDGYIGKILKAIDKNRRLSGHTYLIVTAAHGGDGDDHQDVYNKHNFTVPFIVWGPALAKGADLYVLNKDTRRDPEDRLIPYENDVQPIRNSEAGNLALSLLELPAIPHSVINARQSLRVK